MEAVDPTCTEPGYTDGNYCPTCGKIVSGVKMIEATGHAEVVIGAVQRTCTEPGRTGYAYCEICLEQLYEDE